MKLIGIDVGITGAVATIVDGEFINVIDMPVMKKTAGKGNMIDYVKLGSMMMDEVFYTPDKVIIESVHAMPQQGGVSNFSFGRALGIIEGILGGIIMAGSFDIQYCTPQAWKKAAGLIGKPKDEARKVARQLFPEAKTFLTRKKDIGRADAILIAKFGSKK